MKRRIVPLGQEPIFVTVFTPEEDWRRIFCFDGACGHGCSETVILRDLRVGIGLSKSPQLQKLVGGKGSYYRKNLESDSRQRVTAPSTTLSPNFLIRMNMHPSQQATVSALRCLQLSGLCKGFG